MKIPDTFEGKVKKVIGWLKSPRNSREVLRLLFKMCPDREEAMKINDKACDEFLQKEYARHRRGP